MKLILLGAPGSGKGTQAAYISGKYGLPHISTGDLFRENISNRTAVGLKVMAVMETGNLCPDDLTVEMVKERLKDKDCENGYLLDGFPRNVIQAKALDEISAPDKVINLSVDLEKIEHRLTGRRCCLKCKASYHVDNIGSIVRCPQCGGELITRKDDNSETVKERLTVYAGQTAPLVDYYANQGKIVNVDGNQKVDRVFAEIVKVLG